MCSLHANKTLYHPPPPQGRVGAPYELTLLVSGEVGTVSWSVTSGSLPPGLALDPMSGVIAVLATPYFAVTAADGRYAIDAPLGDYRLHFWQEYAEPDALAKLERSVRVGDQAVTIAEETIAVRAVSVVDHKDKYGHDYHVKPPEYIFYPGVRR